MKVQQSLRLAHTSSVAISVVVNLILVVALLTFITFSDGQQRDVSTVMVIDPVEQELIEEIQEEIEPEEVVDPEELDELVDFNMDMEMETDFEPEVVEERVTTEVSSLTELMSDVSSPVVMAGLLVGRTPRARQAMAARHGRGLEKFSEPAVLKALEWLRDHQHASGGWNKNGITSGNSGVNAGYTGLALLAFLAHGETPSSAEFGPTVARGIRYLIENQGSNGVFQPAGAHTGYGHAMATYAIAEAYTMTENPLLRPPLEKAVEVIIKGQQPRGGYDYDYKKGDRNDISLGAWHVQALKAASIAMPDNNRVKKFLQSGMDGLMEGSLVRDTGNLAFYYKKMGDKRPEGFNRVVTSAGTLCLFLSGRGESKEAKSAIRNLEDLFVRDAKNLPTWNAPRKGTSHGGLINIWYYAVQAFFQENPDGGNFRKYMPYMVKALAQNQAPDGHWLCYSESGANQGKTYNTTLAALGLMVYYRYLPSTQAKNIQTLESVAPVEEEEVGFEI